MILGKCETVKRAKAWMKRWRVEQATGFVIFFNGNACEWAYQLPENDRNRPGCIVVNIETGERFEARGGTYGGGHEGWRPIAGDPAFVCEQGCGDCDPCIFGRPDQCAVDRTVRIYTD